MIGLQGACRGQTAVEVVRRDLLAAASKGEESGVRLLAVNYSKERIAYELVVG